MEGQVMGKMMGKQADGRDIGGMEGLAGTRDGKADAGTSGWGGRMDGSTREGWVGEKMGWKKRRVDEEMEGQGDSGWMKDGKMSVRVWKAVRAAERKKEGMVVVLEGSKREWTEGEGLTGWALEGNGAEESPRASAGQGGQGPGAVRCTALRWGSGRGIRPYLAGTC